MPIAGERRDYAKMGQGYASDPMRNLASAFLNLNKNVYDESGVDLMRDSTDALMRKSSRNTLKKFFTENAVDENEYKDNPTGYDDQVSMMEEMFENDREALLEYAPLGGYNPVIGMSFPIHKNILMNSIYDKGGIPKVVAVSPKFTISMEYRYIVDAQGNKYDIFKEQSKITDAMDSSVPFIDIDMTLPEKGTTNIINKLGAAGYDNVSIQSFISAVQLPLKYKSGDTLPDGSAATADTVVDTWVPVNFEFSSSYGEHDRTVMRTVDLPANIDGTPETTDVISGFMEDNKFTIQSMKGIIKAVRIRAKKDTSNGMNPACSVDWRVKTDLMEIPEAIHLNVPISPEEVKDIGALYQVNQLTKVMSIVKLCLENYKDDHIRRNLSDSYDRLKDDQKFYGTFDMNPREGYALDHVEWRSKSFMDVFDSYITDLLKVLNDPNVTISVFGRPDLIRKITPVDHTYQTPPSIGPVELDFNKTIVTSDKRVYQFMSSQKLNSNDSQASLNPDDFSIVLNPRNTERIIYRIYDYQMYASNEIRNAVKYALPAIDAFERWKFIEYQPVQGRMHILNPRGFKNM